MEKELELEAEEYAELQLKGLADKSSKFECVNDFIAGVNSKYVEKQKIQFAIEQLKQCMKKEHLLEVSKKIKELQQKLSEL